MLRQNVKKAAEIEASITDKRTRFNLIKGAPSSSLYIGIQKDKHDAFLITSLTIDDERTIADLKRVLLGGLEWEIAKLEKQLEEIL